MSFLVVPTIFKLSTYTATISNSDVVFLIKIPRQISSFLNFFSRSY
jgi:hypothetical protein